MDSKVFKKPPLPSMRNKPLSSKENVKPRAIGQIQTETPRKHNCMDALARSMSASSDDSKATSSKNGSVHSVDLADWESKAKQALRAFCTTNGLDIKMFYVDGDRKKIAFASKTGVSQPPAQSANKLLPIFKALDTLMVEKRFPPTDIMQLLKPLDGSFFVKQCAYYWHLFAKAAVTAGDYSVSLELLERGTKYGAQPLMEMLRAYGSVSRRLVDVINGSKAGQPSAGNVETEVKNTTNGSQEELIADDAQGDAEAPAGEVDADDNHAGLDVTIDLSDPVGSNAGQDDNNTEAMDHGGEPENTETETGVETMADVEEKNMEAPQFEPMPLNEEVVASDELHGENGQAERQSLEAQEATELDHIVENADHNALRDVADQTDRSLGTLGSMMNGDMDNGTPSGAASAMAVASPDHAASNNSPARETSDLDEVPELPGASMATPATIRRHGTKKNEVDQEAIFQSSAKKFVVVQNKSAKKQQGADKNEPAYLVTPVRRSTRKTSGYEKWFAYRNPAVDSPSDIRELGVDEKKTAFKKNPYLLSDDDSD